MGKNDEGTSSARVLLIDDNPAIHEDFRTIFASSSETGYLAEFSETIARPDKSGRTTRVDIELASAFQGQDGWAIAKVAVTAGRPFSLAFVGMQMSHGWSGLETIEHLWEVDPELHIVICTAFSDDSWSNVVTRLGSNDRWFVLKKPFDNAEVCQMALVLIEKQRMARRIRSQMAELQGLVNEQTRALREREARMCAMFETVPDGIVLFDVTGRIEAVNQTALRLFGYLTDELRGMSVWSLISERDIPPGTRVEELFCEITQHQPAACEVTSIRKDDSCFPSHWTVGLYECPELSFYTAIIRDLSEHRQLQCELAQAQKLESVGQLAAGIAHEINTPTQYVNDNTRFIQDAFHDLSRVIVASQQLLVACERGERNGTLVKQARESMERADVEYLLEELPQTIEQTLDGVQRIGSIVRAMKEFSHPGSTDKTLANLHKLLETTITVSRNEWKHVAEIETEFADEMQLVPCLVCELNQVFLNLVVNAAHAIGASRQEGESAKGKITIRTAYRGDWAEVQVADTGTGIPEAIVGRVFDPFFTTKEVGHGTGQGLAIARSVVVDKHGGTIDIQTAVGKGSTFRVRLPLACATEETKPNARTNGQPAPVASC